MWSDRYEVEGALDPVGSGSSPLLSFCPDQQRILDLAANTLAGVHLYRICEL